jgi:response regulator RpfG family c-di-GMP phosphodiesterase
MSEKVLCVDDDRNILDAYMRQLRKEFHLVTAEGAREGLEAIRTQGPFAVIVSDMRMPEIDGLKFLVMARELAPQTVRMMLTGNDDLTTAVNAINEGNIFRFMSKPCPPDAFAKSIHAGIDQYRLLRSEKELIERTLKGSVKVLTDILALSAPQAFGRASRARRLAGEITAALKLENAWQVDLAAMLSQIGCATVPPDILDKAVRGEELTEEQSAIFRTHPGVGSDLLKNIPRLETIADIIFHQDRRFAGNGSADKGPIGEDIPIGARILKAALDYDALVHGGTDPAQAIASLNAAKGTYDPAVLEVLGELCEVKQPRDVRTISAARIAPGMILAHDLMSTTRMLLLAKGQEITASLCACLKNMEKRGVHVAEPIHILDVAR